MKTLFFVFLCSVVFHSILAHPGVGIVMDQGGNVLYTDLVYVWKIAPDGKRSIAVENVHTHQLYLDTNGDLYGEHEWYKGNDVWGNYVWCLSKDGILETYLPEVEGFLDNTTLTRDLEGNSYWVKKSNNTHQIMKELLDGSTQIFSTHDFDNIRWMYYSKFNQLLYVVDNLSIKSVSKSGEVTIVSNQLKERNASFGGVADHHYIFGLWSDYNKNLYVALYGARKVKKVSSEGEMTTIYNSPLGWSPCGGLIEKDGTMWIMEFSKWNATRVRKINPNGENISYGNNN